VTPNLGFKVTGLKVECFADGASVFSCTKHCCRSLGALPKTCKKLGVVAEFFFAKTAGSCFNPPIEIKHNSVSLRWNFYAYIQLIREGFWLQLWTAKNLSEPRVSRKYLAKLCKNSKTWSQFAATLRRWTDGAVLGVSIALLTTPRRPRRWRVEPVTCLAKSCNGPKIVPCLLTSTDR